MISNRFSGFSPAVNIAREWGDTTLMFQVYGHHKEAPPLAAGRKNLAHGVSRGFPTTNPQSPGRAKERHASIGRAAILLANAILLGLGSGCAGTQPRQLTPIFSNKTQAHVIGIIDDRFLRRSSGSEAVAAKASASLAAPATLALASDGAMVIADQKSGHILYLAPDGTLQANVAVSDARGLSSLRTPRFLRVDLTGNVYVSDGAGDRVAVYDSRLRPSSDLSPPYDALGLPPGQITGLAFGAYGEFYMADQVNRRIYRFDANGRFISEFSGEEVPWARLRRPMGIACATVDGSVYVCDPGERRIAVFDNSGLPVRSFGESELIEPVAIALDRHGQSFVADSGAKAVLVFTSSGQFAGHIDGQRIGFADFAGPTDVVLRDSTLYVADPFNGHILQIRLRATTPSR